tara:strand:- start:16351 stop:16569 length:219 start_codon:yes stop_codon:yes gene_type:complete
MTYKAKLNVGDLVQLGSNYKNRGRWAIVAKCERYDSHCSIVYLDTGEKVRAIKSGLIVYSNLEDKNESRRPS